MNADEMREHILLVLAEALTSGDEPAESPSYYPDEVEESGRLAYLMRDAYDAQYDALRTEALANRGDVIEAFLVGQSRGDDATNYSLAYGEPVPHTPEDRPLFIERGTNMQQDVYLLGWASGVRHATKRHADLDTPDAP